jgi:hypothetical protein
MTHAYRDEQGRFARMPRLHPAGLSAREAQSLFSWRFACLRQAGFDSRAARTLALDFEADLHLAVKLVKDGCPEDTAVRIVL